MPVLRPRFELRLGSYEVTAVSQIRVTLSRKLPADSCEIELPFHPQFALEEFKKGGLAVGSEVIVKLGYDSPEPVTVFTGVVTEVSPNQPLKIKCEDHAWALKQKRFLKKTFSSHNKGPLGAEETWYSEIGAYAIAQAGLEYLIPIRYDKKQGDAMRKSFSVNNQTCAQVIEELRKNGWDYFCLPGTKQIYFGPPWPWGAGILPQEEKYRFTIGYPNEFDPERPPNVIKTDGLAFTPARKVGKVIVYLTDSEFTGRSVKGEWPPDGKDEPIEEYNFDESGKDKDLKAIALGKAKLLHEQLNSNSFQGSFQTIGHPFLTHSVEIELYDSHHSERTSQYWIDQVAHVYGPNEGFVTNVSLCERGEV